jgi:ppGpp synthetase/RelA/SpoT-type nucleotidyltranferase
LSLRENMKALTPTDILVLYDTQRPQLEAFRDSCQRLLESLLKADGINVHSVNSRTKDRDSLSEKLARPGKEYGSLDDVTDLVGLRVITYFEDEVQRIGSLIEREFTVDPDLSIDKREALNPDQFGYVSQHYICRFNEARLKLAEHRHCSGFIAEIQVRTILQHAWAEIEHDLGYKAPGQVARPIRRRFSRLAGLLELADAEFSRLRDDISQYKEEVREKIETRPAEVQIDEISLNQFLGSDDLSSEMDAEMAAFVGAKLVQSFGPGVNLPGLLRFVNVETIDQLKKELSRLRKPILAVWRRRYAGKHLDRISRGMSSVYLFLILAARGGVPAITEAFKKCWFITDENMLMERAANILADIEAANRG